MACPSLYPARYMLIGYDSGGTPEVAFDSDDLAEVERYAADYRLAYRWDGILDRQERKWIDAEHVDRVVAEILEDRALDREHECREGAALRARQI